MPKISEILREATVQLQSAGISDPRREAGSLLTFALGKDKTFLIAHSEYELTAEEETRFAKLLQRRERREPLQYITGRQEFYGLDFTVTPDVLIPRPETELIVEHALEILQPRENPSFCEIGVGSGCISVAILHEEKSATAIGLDVSEKALEIARLNAANNGVAERLKLKISDVFAALENEKYDLIVSNPPYIPRQHIETLQAEVRDFEPHIALTDERDGLSIVTKIVDEAPFFLKPAGFLLMEIGVNQAAEVREMFAAKVWAELDIRPDLQGIPRMVRARLAAGADY